MKSRITNKEIDSIIKETLKKVQIQALSMGAKAMAGSILKIAKDDISTDEKLKKIEIKPPRYLPRETCAV